MTKLASNPIPAAIYNAFERKAPRLTPQALGDLLVVKCQEKTLSAKVAFQTIARACPLLQLTSGRRVTDSSDFREFFEELSQLLPEEDQI